MVTKAMKIAGYGGDPGIFDLVHSDDHGGADDQAAGGQELVAHAEERPDGGDIPGIDQVAPGEGKDEAGDDDAGHPASLQEFGDEFADHFLEEETANPGAGIHGGEDEDGLEHDGESGTSTPSGASMKGMEEKM